MHVAITGANGFIGRHLVSHFTAAGCAVTPIVRADLSAVAQGPQHVEHLLAGADVVVHAAGATRAPTKEQLYDSNVELTRRLVGAARTSGVARFVFISSQAASGPAPSRGESIIESAPCAPIETYGRSKRDAELIVRDAGAQGLPFVIVRPSSVYGAGDRDFLSLFRLARRRMAIHPANRDHWISIVEVRDLADAIVSAATQPDAVGETFFLCNDDPVQWSTLFELAARAAGVNLSVDFELPAPLVNVGATLGDIAARLTGHAGLLTSEKVALSRPRYWICSNARAKRVLSLSAQISLQRGFEETYHWYRQQQWL